MAVETRIRLADFPQLATLGDGSEFIGQNGGAGYFTGAQVKAYVLSEIEADLAALSSAFLTLQADAASASALLALQTTVDGHGSSISALFETTADQASSLVTLSTTQGAHSASISSLQETRVDHAATLNTLTVASNGHTSQIATLQNVNDVLGASYVLRTDVNGMVAGFSLTNNGTPIGNNITFTTDNFRILPTGSESSAPIFETVGGVAYIANAAIREAAIDSFRMADGSVLSSKIALYAASEAVSFYRDTHAQPWDAVNWHDYVGGSVTVPAGGAAYLYVRSQGYTYNGSGFAFRLLVNGLEVVRLPDPATGWAIGLQSLQERTFPVILGVGTHSLMLQFIPYSVPADPYQTSKAVLGHIVGWVQKR